jgi:protein transport protein SEC31
LPEGTTDVDGLVTKSLLMGDFEGAVGLCVIAKHWADALILSMQSKSDTLLLETQKGYFQVQACLQASREGYLNILKDVIVGNLEDVVKNANLEEWKGVIVVVCTFAAVPCSFERLLETLGKRLEAKLSATLEAAENASGDGVDSKEWRKGYEPFRVCK